MKTSKTLSIKKDINKGTISRWVKNSFEALTLAANAIAGAIEDVGRAAEAEGAAQFIDINDSNIDYKSSIGEMGSAAAAVAGEALDKATTIVGRTAEAAAFVGSKYANGAINQIGSQTEDNVINTVKAVLKNVKDQSEVQADPHFDSYGYHAIDEVDDDDIEVSPEEDDLRPEPAPSQQPIMQRLSNANYFTRTKNI